MSLGPRSYAEIFDWPTKGLESIAVACKCRGRDAMAYLQGLMSCSAEIVLTTHFSGMGTSEMALAMIEDMLQQHGISLPMRVHSATDINHDCRKVLMSYQPPHGPEHVFGDILDRLPEQAKDRLIARQLYYKQQFEKASGNGTSPHGGVSKRNLAREVGNRFIQETINILLQERGMLCDQAFCYRHECNCPIFPDGLAGHQFHLEIAGSVCTPWSLQGAGLGWLDPASLPFMVWAIQLKKAQPHAFLHECTPSFPVDVLAQIVDEFKVEAATFCPTDFGIPQSRRRVYCKGSHITKVTRVLDYNMTVLQEVFFSVCRRLMAPRTFAPQPQRCRPTSPRWLRRAGFPRIHEARPMRAAMCSALGTRCGWRDTRTLRGPTATARGSWSISRRTVRTGA